MRNSINLRNLKSCGIIVIFVNQKAFTEAAFTVVQEATGLAEDSIYLTYSEFANWGTKGSMK